MGIESQAHREDGNDLALPPGKRRHNPPPATTDDDVVVRCSKGHIYTTVWNPIVSFKAIRLGSQRYQRCPVGGHWALVRRVPVGELTDEELAQAMAVRDGNLM